MTGPCKERFVTVMCLAEVERPHLVEGSGFRMDTWCFLFCHRREGRLGRRARLTISKTAHFLSTHCFVCLRLWCALRSRYCLPQCESLMRPTASRINEARSLYPAMAPDLHSRRHKRILPSKYGLLLQAWHSAQIGMEQTGVTGRNLARS